MKKVYKQWLVEKGELEVELIEFIDYVRANGKIKKIKQDGKIFIGEIWKAEFEGSEIEVKIKSEYDPDLFDSKINEPLPSHLIDNWYNPIIDQQEYVHLCLKYWNTKHISRRKHNRNWQLEKRQQRDIRYTEKLKKILKLSKYWDRTKENNIFKKYIELKLSFYLSPDYYKFRNLQKQKHLNEKLNHIITHTD